MDVDMVKSNNVGHDDDTEKTSNYQMQPKETHDAMKCNLCHPSPSKDIFDDYYFCEMCLIQL